MGLFGKDKSHKSTKEIKNYEIRQGSTSKLLFDIKQNCTFEHGDKLTNLITARLLDNYEKRKSIAPDSAKYLCFELRNNIDLQELVDKKIFDILNQIGKFKHLEDGKYNHIGIIDKVDNRFQLFNPTNEVLSYVEHVIDRKLFNEKEFFHERVLHSAFQEKLAIPASEYIKENTKEQEERKKHPYLEEQYRYNIDNKRYANYQGVDMSDGKRINICRLTELLKENDQTLYSAYIQKLEEDDRKELKALNQPPQNGQAVMFMTETKIQNLSENDDKEEMINFLKLVSNLPKNRTNQIEYIGSLNKKGEINKELLNCSEEIKSKIEEEKELFKKENQQEMEEMEI